MQRARSVFNSTTFRLVVFYIAVFSLSVTALFTAVFLLTDRFASQRIDEAIATEISALRDLYVQGGAPALQRTILERSNLGPEAPGVYLLVDPVGRKLAGNLSSWPTEVEGGDPWINFTIQDLRGAAPAVADVRAQQFFTNERLLLLVGRDVRDLRDFRGQLLRALYTGLGITIGLGLLGGVVVSRVFLGRINEVAETCKTIIQGDLSKRVETRSDGDEFAKLARNINAMLDQIQGLMDGMRQVSDNVAHDLRTPLARLQGRLEDALRQTGSDAPQREAIQSAIEETGAILDTFKALLRIARVESGLARESNPIDLVAISESVVELYEPIAEDKSINLKLKAESTSDVRGDPHLVFQAIANLLDNALKYTPTGGEVHLDVGTKQGTASVTISDSGPGIPDTQKDKVFQRLFRIDQSRSTPGNGLGLSLVSAVVKAHGASISLSDNDPGLVATILFPDAPAA